jgi:hypothetical protein
MRNSIFWVVSPRDSCKNRRFGRSSETSVLTRTTWRHIPEDDIFHCHRRGNLRVYKIAMNIAIISQGYTVCISSYVEHGHIVLVISFSDLTVMITIVRNKLCISCRLTLVTIMNCRTCAGLEQEGRMWMWQAGPQGLHFGECSGNCVHEASSDRNFTQIYLNEKGISESQGDEHEWRKLWAVVVLMSSRIHSYSLQHSCSYRSANTTTHICPKYFFSFHWFSIHACDYGRCWKSQQLNAIAPHHKRDRAEAHGILRAVFPLSRSSWSVCQVQVKQPNAMNAYGRVRV